MKNKIIFLLFLCFLNFPFISQAGTNDELIQRIASASNQELSWMTFFELNILKNAIFSSKGFRYADDREWLYEYFYDTNSKLNQQTTAGYWDMSWYDFRKPSPDTIFEVDPIMEKAISNVRVALLKKIRSYKDINEIDKIIEEEAAQHFLRDKEKFVVLGRQIKGDPTSFVKSIKREVRGYNRIIGIIEDASKFDACELLGVYVGSIILLKNCIEARQGKPFEGTMAWEISQLIGVTPQNTKYDENKLPPEIKSKIELLEKVIRKMTQSDIGDIPGQFKTKDIKIELLYYEEGC